MSADCPCILAVTVANPAPAVVGVQVVNPAPEVLAVEVAESGGANPLQFTALAAAVLSSNCLVHVQADGQLIRADASLGLLAHGLVRAAAGVGDLCRVLTGGLVNGLSGRTPGAPQFLGLSGQFSETPPSASGHLWQEVGAAITPQQISLELQPVIELA